MKTESVRWAPARGILAIWIFSALLSVSLSLEAQVNTGQITGYIYDPSNAAVPAATVRATNEATNVVTTTQSAEAGSYLANYLVPGTYKIEVTKEGFTTDVETGIRVTAGQATRLDLTLKLGQVRNIVQVKANPLVVNTENAQEAWNFDHQTLDDLPNIDRNPLLGLSLLPGANSGAGSGNYFTNGNEDGSAAAQLNPQLSSFGGLDANANSVYIEGIPTREPQNAYISLVPPPDAVEELNVETGKYDVEYGFTATGAINVVTKSGTNKFHGDVFEYLENDALNARPFFAESNTPFKRNQFGGSVGGPILKDKLFFFGDFQSTHMVQSSPSITTAPTTAMYNGDFSELYTPGCTDAAGNVCGQLYNPFTRLFDSQGNQLSVQPIQGNMIPQAMWDSAAKNMNSAQIFGVANAPGIVNNLYYLDRLNQTPNQGDGRIDYSISDKSKLFFRYSVLHAPILASTTINKFINDYGANSNSLNQNMGLTFDQVFSSTKMNEFRVGYNRSNVTTSNNSNDQNYNNNFGIANGNIGGDTQGMAEIYVDPLNTVGTPDWVAFIISNTFSASDNFTWVKGRHTLKFGAMFNHVEDTSADTIGGDDPRGLISFDSAMTSFNGSGLDYGYPAFLLGAPVSITRTRFSQGFPYQTYWENGFYGQDNFHVTSSLTLNLGLRWELYSLPVERDNRQANWDTSANQLVVATSNNRSPAIKTDYKDWEPRVGFAWSPDHGKTSIRGGYGSSYWQNYWNGAQSILTVLGATYPFYVKQSFLTPNNLTPSVSLTNDGIPIASPVYDSQGNLLIPDGALIRGVQSNYRNQKVSQYSFDVQRQVGELVVDIGYLRVIGDNNPVTININQAPPSSVIGIDYNQNRPLYNSYPQLGDVPISESIGISDYNALVASVRGNVTRYLQVLGTYAFGRNFSNGNNIDQTNVNQYYGPTTQDIPHIFSLELVSPLPFGHGMNYLSNVNPIVDGFIGGWRASALIHVQSGPRFTVGSAVSLLNNGQGNRPNVICNPNLPGGQRTLDRWFNTGCFVDDLVPGTYGNEGTNLLRADGEQQVNFSLEKNISMTERLNLQFRADFDNLFNHPNFGVPNSTVGSGAFGTVTSTSVSPRIIQLGLRLSF
jgi:Carboxypeptidase regulatory-like domain